MSTKSVLTDLDFGNAGRISGLLDCASPQDAATKAYVDARSPKITVSTTAPGSPSVGDLWVDTN
jgi:hypothetical protein